MEHKEFKRQLDELRTIITDGIAYFSAWQAIANLDENSAHALNRYRGFFLPAQVSLKNMALLQFSKIFDPDTRTISLRNLLSAVKENRQLLTPHAEEDDLKRIEHLIDSNEESLNHLKGFRDQRLAHHDKVISSDTSLTFGKVRKLIDDVKVIYNSLSRGHERSTTAFDFISREAERHTLQVIEIMCEERDRAKERISEIDTHE